MSDTKSLALAVGGIAVLECPGVPIQRPLRQASKMTNGSLFGIYRFRCVRSDTSKVRPASLRC